MTAVKTPLCLVLDAAANLALALLKLNHVDFALWVLQLKTPEAHQFLTDAARGELTPLAESREIFCRVCTQQQRVLDADHHSSAVGALERRPNSCTGLGKSLHLLQAAGGVVLLHATAALGALRSHERRCSELDTRESVLQCIRNLNALLGALNAFKAALRGAPLPAEVPVFAHQTVALTERLCAHLASGGYSGTAADLLSQCLQRVLPLEPKPTFHPYMPFLWPLAQLHARDGRWAEVQQICSFALKTLSAAARDVFCIHWRRDSAYKQLLFTALMIKGKVWSQALLPGGAFCMALS